MITVGHSGASRLELPSVDLEGSEIGAGVNSCNLPGDITTIGTWVSPKPVKGAGVVGTIGVGRLESKAKGNRVTGGLAAENSANNAHVEVIGRPARSQAKQARGLAAVQLGGLVGRKDWEKIAAG